MCAAVLVFLLGPLLWFVLTVHAVDKGKPFYEPAK
jgi:hypothetical protein